MEKAIGSASGDRSSGIHVSFVIFHLSLLGLTSTVRRGRNIPLTQKIQKDDSHVWSKQHTAETNAMT
jgi:hypothetical protein